MNISVIIPTYKPQAYLWECLNSLVAQTFPKEEFEVILVLNGCAEPWKSQIQEYIDSKMKCLNVNFIHTEEGGVSNARNLALEVAKGEYITFIDDDDFVSPRYLELLYDKASQDTIPLCYPLSFIDGTECYEPYYITSQYREASGKYSYIKARKYFAGPVYKLISKEAVGNRRFNTKFRNGEDSLFMFLISDKFKYVEFAGKDAVYYRRFRQNSATTVHRRRFQIVCNELKRDWELTKIYLSSPFKYSLMFYIINILGSIHTMIEPIKEMNTVGNNNKKDVMTRQEDNM